MPRSSPDPLDGPGGSFADGSAVVGAASPELTGGSDRVHGTTQKAVRLAGGGHAAFAVTLAFLGVLGAVKGDFTPIWQPVSRGLPARESLVYLCAAVSLVCGLGILWQRAAAVASGVLLAFLLGWLLLLAAPLLVLHPGMEMGWAAGQMAALVAAAWVLYGWSAGRHAGARPGFGTGDAGLRVARALYGLALIVFGIAHFTYFARTVAMVPGWLPWHRAWASFFGCTFIAAGVALLSGVCARLAATLSVVQLGMFTVLVWVPVVAAGASASDWHEFVVSWTLTAAAWVLADSYRAGAGRTQAG